MTEQHPADGADPSAPWHVANVRPVLDTRFLRVELADITKPSGQHEQQHMVHLLPAVVVVVLDEPGEHVLLTWRHRCVPNVWSYEMPGGPIEHHKQPAEPPSGNCPKKPATAHALCGTW